MSLFVESRTSRTDMYFTMYAPSDGPLASDLDTLNSSLNSATEVPGLRSGALTGIDSSEVIFDYNI